MTVSGFSLKSATLVLQTLRKKPFMVAVDRHLRRSLIGLKWVHEECSSPTECSVQISQWLPKSEYIHVNNIIAGLCQLLQMKTTKHRVLRLANSCGVKQQIDILCDVSSKRKSIAMKSE